MYYRLDWKTIPTDPALANTGGCDNPGSVPWTMGEYFNGTVEQPVRCTLHPKRGRVMRDMFLVDVPLFSDRLLTALREAGVDNLQTFDAEIRSPEGVIFTNYRAVNILGLVACADMHRSQYQAGSEPPIVEFTKVVIDESKANRHPFFRLAENTLYILASDHVRSVLSSYELTGVSLTALESAA